MERVEGRAMVIYEFLLKVLVLGIIILGPYHSHAAEANYSITKPGCQSSCGNLSIPYPFGSSGSSSDCHYNFPSFIVYCDYLQDPPIPYMDNKSSNLQIGNISVEDHEMRIFVWAGRDCYNSSGYDEYSSFYPWLTLAKFPMSSTKNKFTAVGCDTSASFFDDRKKLSFGCMSSCNNLTDASDESCSGIGCCETSIPRNSFNYNFSIKSFSDHSDVLAFNPCSHAFVAEIGSYNFSVGDLSKLRFEKQTLVLDWAVGNQSCEEAQKNSTSYMCTTNSNCTDAKNGYGYKCTCKEGYRGNPYLANGCQDIDECADLEKNPFEGNWNNIEGNYTCSCSKVYHGYDINECVISKPCVGECTNLPGTYNCSCPVGSQGDGRKDGNGCTTIIHEKRFRSIDVVLGVSISFLLILLGVSWLYWGLRERKISRQREKFFQENGGRLMLQRLLSEHEGSVESAKIFTDEELKKATDHYHESRILGQGGQGTVYRGILPDNTVVAIKKAKILDRSQVEEFINELIILSQVNHRNVVKLIGCCFETEVPLLVYEFVNNGTLANHIHKCGHEFTLSWRARLRIAGETAGALSYLHSDASAQILHRDIKSTNILLDENYTAKVADFGASRLVPLDRTQLTTLVQGTLGYLDPEYFHSSQLTEKSDVYSFGVVLAELLTGLMALSFERAENERNLSLYFTSAIKGERLFEIINPRVLNEGNPEEIKEVAMLANRCLRVKREDWPTMKEVAMELEGLMRVMDRHPWVNHSRDLEEAEHLLGERSRECDGILKSNASGNDDSICKQVSFEVESGR